MVQIFYISLFLNVYTKIQITMRTDLVRIYTSTQTLQRELKDPFTITFDINKSGL